MQNTGGSIGKAVEYCESCGYSFVIKDHVFCDECLKGEENCMSVEKVAAFKISNGIIFEDETEAIQAESVEEFRNWYRHSYLEANIAGVVHRDAAMAWLLQNKENIYKFFETYYI